MKKVTGVSTLAQKLLSELNWRFWFVLDPSNVCFDGISSHQHYLIHPTKNYSVII